ncbi:MAG: EamA family transporter [Ruminococcus sp.]|nr:EamA family transporter [Ruminococcus sp.]MEE1016073.1 SMR family transporter [Ruminococcus sp.]
MSKDTMVIIFSGVFLCSVLISSISQILLKKSADRTYDSRLKEYLNPLVIVAYIMFFCSMMITMYCYRYVDVSAGPIFESAGYVFVGILGFIFLKEKFTAKKTIGMVLILLGIVVFSFGGEIFNFISKMFA